MSLLVYDGAFRASQTSAQLKGWKHVAIGMGLAICAGVGAAESFDNVGTIVPPFPTGWQSDGGMCIAGSLGQERVCEFSLGVVRKASQRALYIGKMVAPFDAKTPRWLVTDQMPYPMAPKGFQVVIAPCELEDKAAEMTIAIVRSTKKEWYERVQAAYRANLQTSLFEIVPIKGMRCLNEGAGV